LLQSRQWVERAWGAYLAGRLHSDDLEQSLIQQFQSAAALHGFGSYSDEWWSLNVLFDVAIHSDIVVPPRAARTI
jgi:hypothetical protein